MAPDYTGAADLMRLGYPAAKTGGDADSLVSTDCSRALEYGLIAAWREETPGQWRIAASAAANLIAGDRADAGAGVQTQALALAQARRWRERGRGRGRGRHFTPMARIGLTTPETVRRALARLVRGAKPWPGGVRFGMKVISPSAKR